MNVLLAQGSRVVRNCLRSALRSTRYAAATMLDLDNGGDVLRSLKGGVDPDTLILLDWNLPGLDVPTFLGHLGRHSMLEQISVLLFVNCSQVPLAEQALRQGARGYLTRPFTDAELVAKIEALGASRNPASGVLREVVTTLRGTEDLPSLLSLPSAIIAQIFDGASKLRYEAGTPLLNPGEPVESLPFVTSGEVEIVSAGNAAGRITRGAGECYAERAFICGEPAKLEVRALSAVEVILVPKETMVEVARRHPVLQDFLTLLLTRRSPAESEGVSEMSGTTGSLSFFDLVQFLHSTRKTGVLLLDNKGTAGTIRFEQGEVCDARTPDQAGEGAFYQLAGWSDARFEFRAGRLAGARSICLTTMKLLMNAYAEAQSLPAASPDGSTLFASVG